MQRISHSEDSLEIPVAMHKLAHALSQVGTDEMIKKAY